MVTVGPGIAGVLVARAGYAWTYTVDVVLFFAGFFGLWTLPRIRPEGEHVAAGGFRSVVDGLAHLRRAPNVRMSFVVDIIAMTFGQPMVLFPAVGAIVIGGGSVTAGILLASFAVGGIVSSLGSGRVTGLRWQGLAIRNAIVSYGLAILGFGVVLAVTELGGHAVASMDFGDVNRWALALAALCLAVAGGSDNISAIFRQSILQSAVPDHLRGRTQGVFTVVVTGGPRLGQMFAGTLATLTATWVPPVVGGVLVVVLVVVTVARVPSFRHYDALDPALTRAPPASAQFRTGRTRRELSTRGRRQSSAHFRTGRARGELSTRGAPSVECPFPDGPRAWGTEHSTGRRAPVGQASG